MRVFILAALLLGSSSLSPSFAQEQGKLQQAKPQVEVPQTAAPAKVLPNTEQNSEQPRDQRAGRDPSRADDREMGPDWRMRRGDSDRMGRDDREMGSEGRMRRDDQEMGSGPRMPRDRDTYGEGDGDRGRYTARGDRDRGYADRDRDNRGAFDEEQPRRRVKICVEYDNGDEYCRYRR